MRLMRTKQSVKDISMLSQHNQGSRIALRIDSCKWCRAVDAPSEQIDDTQFMLSDQLKALGIHAQSCVAAVILGNLFTI
jgi:hypothetical protein